jgi:myo-inositol catabolism protein IolC
MLSPREYEKLCVLAADHAFRVISLATESLENDEQALRLMVIVLMALHHDTALQMVETAKLPNGSEPSFNDCRTRILKAVISGKVTDAISDLEYNNAQPRQ